MTELTPEQQASFDAIMSKKPKEPQLTPEQQASFDAIMAKKPKETGWLEGAGRTAASTGVEGVAMLAGLPTTMFNAAQSGVSKLLGVKPNYAPDVQKNIKDFASETTGGYTEYEPTSTAGKAFKNVGTLVPTALAAALTGGTAAIPAALTYGAVVPGLAGTAAKPIGEAVGRAYGSDNPERVGDYFKMGAEILSPSVAAKFGPSLTKVLKDPKLADVADDIGKLEDFGINTTAGSIRQSQEEATKAILREVDNPKLAEKVAKQSQQFSEGVLSKVGITDDTARAMGYGNGISPVNVDRVVDKAAEAIGRSIGNTYNNAQGVNIGSIRSQVGALPGFAPLQPGQNVGEWLHAVRQQANQIKIGAPGAPGASYIPKASKLIDEIDTAFASALGPDDFANLQAMNYHYSRLMTVKGALERAAKSNRTGLITPQDMMAIQGARHTDDLTEISRLANTYLLAKGMIPNEGNRKTIIKYLMDAGAGAITGGGAALMYGADIGNAAKIAMSGLAGGAGMELVQRGLRAARGSDLMQNIAKSKALYAAPNKAIIGAAPSVQAVGMPDRAERKAGGRVSSHEADADQLVRAAERAKKGWSAQTEPLLNHSDESVVHALEVANRSI